MSERTPADIRCPDCGTLHREYRVGVGEDHGWEDGAPVVCDACGGLFMIYRGQLRRMNALGLAVLRRTKYWPGIAAEMAKARAKAGAN